MKTSTHLPFATPQVAELDWNHNGFEMVPKHWEANMPVNLTLKNIPDPLYNRLRISAEANRRSLNMEAITMLEQAFAQRRIPVQEQLERIRKLHASLGPITISHDEIDAFKRDGRE